MELIATPLEQGPMAVPGEVVARFHLALTRRSLPVAETSQPYPPHKVTTAAGTAAMEPVGEAVALEP